ncbi:MAG: hypothetical protein H0W62_13035 [Chitinophagales bacterium]|nr:hypothetical protein [Chitinophagales bacterium]
MKENNNLQKNLFAAIKSKLPSHLSLPAEVAEALNISNDSAYRRIRGEISVSLEELKMLADHFHFSIDQLLQLNEETLLFFGKAVGQQETDFLHHMQTISAHLETITQSHEKSIFCSAKDVPIFHYFNIPELTAFKLYFWMKNIVAVPSLKEVKFRSDFASSSFPLVARMLELYNRCPSTEIWSYETITNVLRQIDFCYYTGWFEKKQDALMLHDQLLRLIHHIQQQAELGKKYSIQANKSNAIAGYEMYVNEVVIGDNSYLAILDQKKLVFLNHAVVNYIMTGDDHFCEITEIYFSNLMKKSVPISSVNEKERSRFFNYMRDAILKQRERLEVQ